MLIIDCSLKVVFEIHFYWI